MIKAFIISILISVTSAAFGADSLRTQIVNGKKVIVHKVEQGNTLYSISKKYSSTVDEIKALNPGMAQLKTGTEIFIPYSKQNVKQEEITELPKKDKGGTDEEMEEIIHKVKPGETLYKISKIYNVPTSDIVKLNNIGTQGIKTGQELIIQKPEHIETAERQKTEITKTKETPPSIAKIERKTSLSGYPSIIETGTARTDETLPPDVYVVLHKNAKPGTLITLKNKENGFIAHARVSGNFPGQELIIINKKVAEKLEAKTTNLNVEIAYTPED